VNGGVLRSIKTKGTKKSKKRKWSHIKVFPFEKKATKNMSEKRGILSR